jgi:hypothetical protein
LCFVLVLVLGRRGMNNGVGVLGAGWSKDIRTKAL